MSQFADLYVYRSNQWQFVGGRLDRGKSAQRLPSSAKEGDHALVYREATKTYTALIPLLQFGPEPVLFQYLSLKKTWEPLVTTQNISHNQAVIDGETAPISKTLEGYRGDILVGKETFKLGEALAFDWAVISRSGKVQPVVCEDKVLWEKDDPNAIPPIDAPDEDRLSAEFERAAVLVNAINENRARIERAPESRQLDLVMDIITNLSPGPVAGTTLPLDLTTFLAEVATMGPVQNGPDGLNVMTGSLQNSPAAPVSTGLGSVAAANSYLQSFGSCVDMINQAIAVHKARKDNSAGDLNTAAGNTAVSAAKLANGLLQAVTKTVQLAQPISTTATQATAGIAGFAGVLLGAVAAARSLRKIYNAKMRINILREQLNSDTASNDLKQCAAIAIQKLTRRMGKQGAMAGSAAIGAIGGTLLTVTAIIGFANAWNPVGWAIVGAGTLVAIGIGCYQLYRRYQRVNTRRKVGIQISGVGGTTTAEQLVQKLVYVSLSEDRSTSDKAFARSVLSAFGVPEDQLGQLSMSSQSLKPIIARFERHFHK